MVVVEDSFRAPYLFRLDSSSFVTPTNIPVWFVYTYKRICISYLRQLQSPLPCSHLYFTICI